MKFLIDAHLPHRLVFLLRAAGHEAIHPLDMPKGNRTTDTEINDTSVRDQYVVLTKDADFENSFYLQGLPYKLLLVSTGNMSNSNLNAIFQANLSVLAAALEEHRFVELTRTTVIIHV